MTEVHNIGLYVLLTITGSGNVQTVEAPSLAICRDMASVALTSMTVAEVDAAELAYKQDSETKLLERYISDLMWEQNHQPRAAHAGWEKTAVKEYKKFVAENGQIFGDYLRVKHDPACVRSCAVVYVMDDGRVTDEPREDFGVTVAFGAYENRPGDFDTTLAGKFVHHPATDIKTARCFRAAE